MTGGLVFIAQGSVIQVQTGLAITFMSISMLCWFKPYVAKRDNYLAVFQQINQFLVLSIVLLMVTKNESKDSAMLSYAMIFLYTASGISMIVIGIFEMVEEYKGGSRQLDVGEFLSKELRDSGADSNEGGGASNIRDAKNVIELTQQRQQGPDSFTGINPLAAEKHTQKVDDSVRRRQDTHGNTVHQL